MEQVLLDQIIALRAQLHACAEVSGREVVTKHTLLTFLREHTSLELHELAGGFYAAHREPEGTKPTVALRADYDALATPQGGAAHLCGHDGHAAALCGVALMLEGQSIGRSVFLLFQGAEETGAGAALCCELFDREKVDEIYGAHNLPGFPFGAVLTRAGTFACASRGVTIHFVGKPAHAAYPETGISPAPAVGQLLVDLPALAAPEQYRGITLCTVIGAQMGEKAFGAAAESAELWLTLRGEHDDDLARLRRSVLTRAQELAHKNHLEFSFEEQDIFPPRKTTRSAPAASCACAAARSCMTRCAGARISATICTAAAARSSAWARARITRRSTPSTTNTPTRFWSRPSRRFGRCSPANKKGPAPRGAGPFFLLVTAIPHNGTRAICSQSAAAFIVRCCLKPFCG